MKSMLLTMLLFTFSTSSFSAIDPTITVEFNIIKEKRADILFVIDNSASMEKHQEILSKFSKAFMSELKNINFKITAISTDKDDSLKNLVIDNRAANPTLQLEELISDFGNIGSADEVPFFNIKRFITQSEGIDFLRAHANLEIIMLTDETDQSDETANDILTALNLRKTTVSAIVPLDRDNRSCGYYDSQTNTKIEDFVALTNGDLIELCQNSKTFEKDYSKLAQAIVSRANISDINALPIRKYELPKNVDIDSIKVFYGTQIFRRGFLQTGWVYDETSNTILLNDNVAISSQSAGTKFTIQFDIN